MPQADFEIQYLLKREKETIGGIALEIDCLQNLNETIDQVFALLEKQGNPGTLEELCPYFGVVWPAARGLAEQLSQEINLQGKTVLEMGCGLAIPSMIAAKKGAQVLATDFHPEVPKFLERNLRLNQIENISYLQINWEKENPDLGKFDLIIGSDVLYESRYAESLATAIQGRLNPGGKVLLADPGRPYLQAFTDSMKRYGFRFETRVLQVPHPPVTQEVFVLEFFPSSS